MSGGPGFNPQYGHLFCWTCAAPTFDSSKPRELSRYFKDLKHLMLCVAINIEEDKKRQVLYIDFNTKQIWKTFHLLHQGHGFTYWQATAIRPHVNMCVVMWMVQCSQDNCWDARCKIWGLAFLQELVLPKRREVGYCERDYVGLC